MNLLRKKSKLLLVTGFTILFCCSGSIKSAFGENEYKWDITPFGSVSFLVRSDGSAGQGSEGEWPTGNSTISAI